MDTREALREIYRRSLWPLPYRARLIADYIRKYRRIPNLKSPRAHSEFMLQRAICDDSPVLQMLCSKQQVKAAAQSELEGTGVRIPETLWQGTEAELISAAAKILAIDQAWVLKPDHLGGGIALLSSGPNDTIDHSDIISLLEASRRAHKIFEKFAPLAWNGTRADYIVEERIGVDTRLNDYKVHVAAGTARVYSIYTSRGSGPLQAQHFDHKWRYIFGRNDEDIDLLPTTRLREKLEALAPKLSLGLPYTRVDFYWHDDVLWFGEVSPFGNMDGLETQPALDHELGRWWNE